MRTSINKHVKEAFIIRKSNNCRIHRPLRTESVNQHSSINIEQKSLQIFQEYSIKAEQVSVTNADSRARGSNSKKNSQYLGILKKPQDFREEIKRKSVKLPLDLSSECFPYTVKTVRISSSTNNANTEESVSKVDSKDSIDYAQKKIKNILGEEDDKSFDTAIGSFESDVSRLKTKNSQDHSFNYKALGITQVDSLTQEMKTLESSNIKKNLVKKKLERVIRPPPKRIDKILAEVNILDNTASGLATEAKTKTEESFNESGGFTGKSNINGKKEANGWYLIRETYKEDEENNKMKIPDIQKKLGEYGKTFNQQISSYKNFMIYNELQNKENIRNEIIEAEKSLKAKQSNLARKRNEKASSNYDKCNNCCKANLIRKIIIDKVLPTQAFQRPRAAEFIKAIKSGDYNVVSELLILDEYLVHEFDTGRQTALHWAAKRNYTKIMKLLLERGADPDVKDLTGRTPLFLASRSSHILCVKLLLTFGANSTIRSDAGKLAIDSATDFHIYHLLKRAFRVIYSEEQISKLSKIFAVINAFPWKQSLEMWKNYDRRQYEVRDFELA